MDNEVNSALDGLKRTALDRLDAMDSAITEIAQKMECARDSSVRGSRNPLSKLGEDDGIKALADGRSRSAVVKMSGSLDVMTKSTIVGDVAGAGEVLFDIPAQRAPGMANDPRPRLSLLDVLPRLRVTSNTFEFMRLNGYANGADYQVTEGDLKAEASLPTDIATANIATIAAWIGASKQVVADAPALQQFVRNLLSYGVRRKLETEVIAGVGGAGKISGLTDTGNFTAFTAAAGASLADSVGKAQSSLQAAGWNPNVVVVNPADWDVARQSKGTDGHYTAGSWRDPAPPAIWGLPVVTNAGITAGNMLVMDTSQVLLLDRQEVTVELGYAEDDFIRNKLRILAELRAGLAVLSPGAVLYGDFSA